MKLLYNIFLTMVIGFLLMSQPIYGQKKSTTLTFEKGNSNWHVQGENIWKRSVSGTIGSVSDQISYLISNGLYDNFELQLEFKCDSTINSGIFIRCADETMSADNCLEINIWDLHPNQDFRTGSIVKIQKPLEKIETIDKWNTYRIKCKKKRVKVWLNGALTANYRDEDFVKGCIGLQANGTGTIEFKNVRIRTFK